MNEAETNSFRTLKEALAKPPVLALPRSYFTYVLDADTCVKQLCAVLMQRYEDISLPPTGCYSRTVTVAKRNYDGTESEYIAIVHAVLIFRPYLYGPPF